MEQQTDQEILIEASSTKAYSKETIARDFPTLTQLEAELQRETERSEDRRDILKNVAFLAIFTAVILILENFVFPLSRVAGSSMEPTLYEKELLLGIVDHTPERGDIVTFRRDDLVLVKRVIAVGGDSVTVSDDGTVSVNGEQLQESYVAEKAYGKTNIEFPVTVPEGEVFVMGDHRSVSVDSRNSLIGTVKNSNILSRVLLRITPFRKFGRIQ